MRFTVAAMTFSTVLWIVVGVYVWGLDQTIMLRVLLAALAASWCLVFNLAFLIAYTKEVSK